AGSATVPTPSLGVSSGPYPIGSVSTFTASATDTDPGPIRYRFRVRPAGGTFSLIRDFSPSGTLLWTPADTEGMYEMEVTARNNSTASTAANSNTVALVPVAAGAPVVNATSHPLVALYSAPPCAAGSTIRVRFKLVADVNWQSTNLKPCGPGTMNFYVGGMRAGSTYQMRQDVIRGPFITTGPTLTF